MKAINPTNRASIIKNLIHLPNWMKENVANGLLQSTSSKEICHPSIKDFPQPGWFVIDKSEKELNPTEEIMETEFCYVKNNNSEIKRIKERYGRYKFLFAGALKSIETTAVNYFGPKYARKQSESPLPYLRRLSSSLKIEDEVFVVVGYAIELALYGYDEPNKDEWEDIDNYSKLICEKIKNKYYSIQRKKSKKFSPD